MDMMEISPCAIAMFILGPFCQIRGISLRFSSWSPADPKISTRSRVEKFKSLLSNSEAPVTLLLNRFHWKNAV